MRKEFVSGIFLVIAMVVICILPVAAVIPSGGTGWIAFKTNVPDASVSINGVVRGTTDSTGEFDIQWDSSFTSYTLTKNLYNDVNGAINFPTGATNIVIPITMTPVPAGSGTGYFIVHANVDGATVSFDGQIMGTTYKLLLTVPVATTADLFTSYAVSEPGTRYSRPRYQEIRQWRDYRPLCHAHSCADCDTVPGLHPIHNGYRGLHRLVCSPQQC